MYLIIGLGNPGNEYKGTRHNIGYDVVEELSRQNGISLDKMKFNSIYGEGRINRERVFLIKPTTYMNRSGEAVQQFAAYYKVPDDRIIVIADDIDIPFASIRIRKSGSAGSHNGLKSIVKSLGSKKFPRMKIGIGSKNPKQDLASFVLGKFTKEEEVYMRESVDLAVKAIEVFLSDGISEAMNQFNNKGGKAQE